MFAFHSIPSFLQIYIFGFTENSLWNPSIFPFSLTISVSTPLHPTFLLSPTFPVAPETGLLPSRGLAPSVYCSLHNIFACFFSTQFFSFFDRFRHPLSCDAALPNISFLVSFYCQMFRSAAMSIFLIFSTCLFLYNPAS